jgi:hypothetical protein
VWDGWIHRRFYDDLTVVRTKWGNASASAASSVIPSFKAFDNLVSGSTAVIGLYSPSAPLFQSLPLSLLPQPRA